MKRFDLKEALKGAKVKTASGCEVEFNVVKVGDEYPIWCIVKLPNGETPFIKYSLEGRPQDREDHTLDLMIAGEKRTGYVNLYGDIAEPHYGRTWVHQSIAETQTDEYHAQGFKYLGTAKIEVEV